MSYFIKEEILVTDLDGNKFSISLEDDGTIVIDEKRNNINSFYSKISPTDWHFIVKSINEKLKLQE